MKIVDVKPTEDMEDSFGDLCQALDDGTHTRCIYIIQEPGRDPEIFSSGYDNIASKLIEIGFDRLIEDKLYGWELEDG